MACSVVLHIEDDKSCARAVALFLGLQGYEVVSAASSDEVIHLIEAGVVPDLIIADYHLPRDITGDQVVVEIMTRLGFRPPTIMLASLSGSDVERVKSVADRIFVKPTDMNVILREIEFLLPRRTSYGGVISGLAGRST